jgi:hypothetical protein
LHDIERFSIFATFTPAPATTKDRGRNVKVPIPPPAADINCIFITLNLVSYLSLPLQTPAAPPGRFSLDLRAISNPKISCQPHPHNKVMALETASKRFSLSIIFNVCFIIITAVLIMFSFFVKIDSG